MLEVGRYVGDISFDPTGSYLYTYIDAFKVKVDFPPASNMAQLETTPGQGKSLEATGGISSDRAWIKMSNQNLLWLLRNNGQGTRL